MRRKLEASWKQRKEEEEEEGATSALVGVGACMVAGVFSLSSQPSLRIVAGYTAVYMEEL